MCQNHECAKLAILSYKYTLSAWLEPVPFYLGSKVIPPDFKLTFEFIMYNFRNGHSMVLRGLCSIFI